MGARIAGRLGLTAPARRTLSARESTPGVYDVTSAQATDKRWRLQGQHFLPFSIYPLPPAAVLPAI
jgi:hypothetical protein